MANSYTIGTIAKTLATVGTTVLQSRLVPLSKIATVIELIPTALDAPLLDSVAAIATVPATTQVTSRTLAANFEDGDCTLAGVELAHKLHVQPFGLSNVDLQGGGRLEWLGELNARALASSISDAAFSLLTIANFGAAAVTKSAANFALADYETLAAGVPSEARAVVLDSGWFVKVKPQTWEPRNTTTYEATRWPAGENVHGFCGDRRAIVCRAGVPMLPALAAPVIARELIQLPQIGLFAEVGVWQSVKYHSIRAAYSIIFAASVGDSAALKLLVSA